MQRRHESKNLFFYRVQSCLYIFDSVIIKVGFHTLTQMLHVSCPDEKIYSLSVIYKPLLPHSSRMMHLYIPRGFRRGPNHGRILCMFIIKEMWTRFDGLT